MAEGTYEYECQRAELLGLERPDYDEFVRNQKDREVTEEQIDVENLKEADLQTEGYKNISSRLDELHSILSTTQKKINRFKTSCGSFTNLLKSKVGYGGSTNSVNSPSDSTIIVDSDRENTTLNPQENCVMTTNTSERKQQLYDTVDNHIDKLDSLIDKAERAHGTMEDQRKRMDKFLK